MRPTAGQGARLTQIAYYSTPKMPNVDLSFMPVSPKTTAVHTRSNAHSSTVDPPPPNKASDMDSPKVALRFKSPAWLAIALGNQSHRLARTPVIDLTRIKGRDSDSEDESVNATDNMKVVVDEEILGHHFTNVRFLKVATGWGEDWNDDKFPLDWPLKLLVIADAITERITTPSIMEGKIQSLVLLFTAALRFESADSKELMKDAEPLDTVYPPIKEEDPEPQADVEPSATPPSLTEGAMPSGASLPAPGAEPPKPQQLSQGQSPKESSAMYTTLLAWVKVLESDDDDDDLFLHAFLPPDLELLHFRGPVSMAAHLDAFAAALAQHHTFLSRLRRISFVLDLPDKASGSPREASLEQLRAAHQACRRLLHATVRERRAVVEGFAEPWVEEHGGLFWEVDDRWGVLDEMAARGR
ncbi:hypothetical protein N658DRAFT_511001 [Parathielavia hyrcaniae]|uniref:Uncharacterized protein n=1 Tax=Parathielavia hyrcaniae TaxID=113614 RepID=A0AAN6PWL0_9PEZI|nr:hypothetical protein N658DRAFT_511001 [Parathielavia hyrcaniae]